MDRSAWPEMARRIGAVFATRTRDEWVRAFAGREACVTPVLSVTEAAAHPHNRARGTYATTGDGGIAPGPAPRFSATPAAPPRPAPPVGAHTREVFAEAGLDPTEIDALLAAGVIS
jgi:alpha-methylacyl-CoA racemase